ncbi:MAG TPA: SLC13 family permease [Steroidobacteraceae bacterium]|nr:SLC13 family permease [Steroidobacteraceae bacterium]
MTFEIIATLTVVFGVLVLLTSSRLETDVVLVGAMIVLTLLGILEPDQALQGFASNGVLTIAALYIVVAGLRETGAMAWISRWVLGRPRSLMIAQSKLMFVTSALSAVVNNTPVVALFIPVAQEWSSRFGYSISKLLLPMNHLVILAGMCTLVGTSTNLIVNSLLVKTVPDSGLSLFSLAWIGLPLTLIGFVYTLIASRWLLPDRQSPVEQLQNAREYSVEARVTPNGPLVGRSIAEVGLRSMRFAYVLEISRGERLLAAVGPDEVLQSNDRVTFVGVVDAVNELRRIPGLLIAEDQTYQLNLRHAQRCLVELVLSPASPLIGQTVRESGFRSTYSAAIISISREGARLEGKLGDVRLRPGDTLLVETDQGFVERHKYNRDFLLVSSLQDSTPPDFARAPFAFLILVMMLLVAGFEWIPLFQASFIAAGVMIASGCVTLNAARRSIEYPVLVGIAASFALGFALAESGAAELLAGWIGGIAKGDPFWALVVLYVATVIITEMITNNAAGVLMFPIAMAVAHDGNASFLPYVVTVMVGASAGFITPIGYQTNLMVYGPGGYRWVDYIRFGTPLSIVVGIATVLIVPRVWPF